MPKNQTCRLQHGWLYLPRLIPVSALLLGACGGTLFAEEPAGLAEVLDRAAGTLAKHENAPVLQTGDADASIADLEQALSAHMGQRADAAKALIILGQLLEQSGRAEEALDAYRRVRANFPEQAASIRIADKHATALRDGRGLFLQGLLLRADIAVGKPRRSKLVDMRVTGSLVVHNENGPLEPRPFITEVSAGGRIRQLHPGRQAASGFDGEHGWSLDPANGRATSLGGPALDRLVAWAEETWREARAALIKGTRSRLMGSRRVQGQLAWTVEFSSATGRRLVHFDAKTALPLMVEGRFQSLDGQSVDRVYLYDYQTVETCQFATRTVYYNGDRIAYEFRFESIEMDPKLDPAIFSAPAGDEDETAVAPQAESAGPKPEAPEQPQLTETRPPELALEQLLTNLSGQDNDLAERSAIELYRRRDPAAVPSLIEVLTQEEQRKPRRPLHGLVLQILRSTTGLNLERAADWRDAWNRRQGEPAPR